MILQIEKGIEEAREALNLIHGEESKKVGLIKRLFNRRKK